MKEFDPQVVAGIEQRLGIWPTRPPTLHLVQPPGQIPFWQRDAWRSLRDATEGKGGDPLNLLLRAVCTATGADCYMDQRRNEGLRVRAAILTGIDRLEMTLGLEEVIRRAHAYACACRGRRVVPIAAEHVLAGLGAPDTEEALKHLPIGLRRVVALLRARAPGFCSESDIETEYRGEGEATSNARAVVSLLKNRHKIPVESAREARGHDSTVPDNAKGYRWAGH